MRKSPEEDLIEAPSVLCFIAATLGELRDRVERVEGHAAGLVAAAPGDAESLIVLQDLDLLRQTIEDLARLAGVAGQGTQTDRQALGGALRLAGLRDRLPGAQVRPDARDMADDVPCGRIEFFVVEGRTRS